MRLSLSLTILLLLFVPACQRGANSTTDNPQSAADYYNRGVERQNKGDADGAIADYTKAIELDPKSFSAYNNRGNLKQDKGKVKEAVVDFQHAVSINPSHATAHFNLGHVYQGKKDYEGAIYEYTKAIEAKPDYAMAYANRGLCNLYLNSDDEAQKDFDRSLAINAEMKNSLDGYITKVKLQRTMRR